MRNRYSAFRQAVGSLALELPTSVILMYHRIAEVTEDPWSICVSPTNFEEQLQVLQSHNCISLNRLMNLGEGRPHRSVALSFDDGYLDNLTEAAPRLLHYSVPATFFVTTGQFESGFWWDRLDPLSGAEYRRVRALPAAERDALLSPETKAPICSKSDLLSLARMNGLDLGAHTVNHPYLPSLDQDSRKKEILDCKLQLEALTETTVEGFAYPYGAYARSLNCVREAGFLWACSTEADRVWSGSEPFCLSRITVPNIGGKEFECFLQAWVE